MIGRWIFVRERVFSRRGRIALAMLVALALVVLLPLRLVLGLVAPEGVTARSVEGPVWSGRIAELRAGPLPIGTVDAGADALPLFLGRVGFRLSREGATPFSAKASLGLGGYRLADVNGTVALPDGLGTLPVTQIGFGDFNLRIADGSCVDAGGSMSLTLAPPGSLLPGTIALSGKARCQRGALVVPMQGPEGMERFTLRLNADGRWEGDLVLMGLPAETAGPLMQAGFTARPGGGLGFRTSGAF